MFSFTVISLSSNGSLWETSSQAEPSCTGYLQSLIQGMLKSISILLIVKTTSWLMLNCKDQIDQISCWSTWAGVAVSLSRFLLWGKLAIILTGKFPVGHY